MKPFKTETAASMKRQAQSAAIEEKSSLPAKLNTTPN